MINFVLDKIQLRNVRRYGNDMMEMDFPLNNLTVFTGKVGAGKSTILKAVSMALYGEDGGAKNQKLSIDDLVNEKNKKNLEIHLYFHSTVDENPTVTNYEIHLFHKHTKYNNKLVFVKDGKDISCASKTETYELIEKTLIPSSVYHNTYYFTQQCKNFFTSLSNSEQKEIFNSILDLSEYAAYYENCKNELDITKTNYEKINSSYMVQDERVKNIVEHIKQRKEEHDKKIIDYKERINNLNIENENLKIECDKLTEEISNFNNVDDDLVKLEMDNQKHCFDMESECRKIDDEIKRITDEHTDTIIPTLKKKYIDLRGERSRDIQAQIEKINSDLSIFKSKNDKQISDINVKYSKIIADKKEEYNNSIADIKEDINTLELEISKLDSICVQDLSNITTMTQNTINEIKEKLSKHSGNKTVLDVKINRLSEEYKDCTSKLKEYKDALDKPDAVCSLCGQKLTNKDHIKKHINDIEKQLDEIKKQGIDYKSQLQTEDSEIESCNVKIKEISDAFAQKKQKIYEKKDNDSKEFKDKLSELKSKLNSMNIDFQAELLNIGDINKKKEIDSILNEFTIYTNNANLKLEDLKKKQSEIDVKIKQEYKDELQTINQKLELKNKELNDSKDVIKSKYNKYLGDEYYSKYQELKAKKDTKNSIEIQLSKVSTILNESTYEVNSITNNINTENANFESFVNTQKNTYNIEEAKLKQLNKEIKESVRKIEILEFWKIAFSDSGIKSMLIDSAIPHMNECVSKELERTAPGKFTVSFDTLSETKSGKVKDKFNINILNNETQSTGHKKLSGGEMRIVDLCCMSALRSLAEKLYGKRFFHIFYDEILDSLDDECKQMFCANVKMQSTSGKNITLVTHDLPEDVDPDRVFPF